MVEHQVVHEYACRFFDNQDKKKLCFRTAEGCRALLGNAAERRRKRHSASVAPSWWLPSAATHAWRPTVQPSLGRNSAQIASQNRLNWRAIQPILPPNSV